MIDLNELKPILEPLLKGDDSAAVIESITAIDKDDFVSKSEIDKINKEWNDRYTKTFFGQSNAEKVVEKDVSDPIPAADETVNEEPEGPTKFDELFKKGE